MTDLRHGAADRPRAEPSAGRALLVDRLLPLVVFAAVLLVFVSTAAYDVIHIDVEAATAESWHLAATGDPNLEGDLTAKMAENKYIFEAPNGHLVGQRMAGPVLAGLPFYWLAGADLAHFGYAPGAVGAACWTACTATLMFLALRRRLTRVQGLAATLAFAFATPTWTVSANMMWTHTVTQFGLAGAAYAASRCRWWWVGVCLAVGMLGRPHIAVVAAVLGLGIAWSRRDVRPLFQVAVPTAASLVGLLAWNRWMFGIWSVGGAYAGKGEAAASGFHGSEEWSGRFAQLVNYAGFLFSPDRGFLVWTPAVLLLLPALRRGWRAVPAWSKLLGLGGVLYTVLQLRINYFPGGDGFYGYRHGLELLTCLTPMLVFALPEAGRMARRFLPVVVALQFGAIALGAVVELVGVPLADVWSDNSFLVAVRTAPALVLPWLVLCLAGGVLAPILVGRNRRRTVDLG